MDGETIAAISTPPGRGGVAVIRVSGPEAFALAQFLTGRMPEPGRIAYARLQAGGKLLDEAVVLAFKGPHSYTGEDTVEFQCHGGSVAPRRVLDGVLAAGARLARRGEFTERAFLNGRLGLEQAEAVIDLIDAKTERAADSALAALGGAADAAKRELYERALALSARLEHALDVDEGTLPDDFLPSVAGEKAALRATIVTALRNLRTGKILREGARVVLVGRPNAGKSSLMNALLHENRAIVSAMPGTTRDSIEEWLDVDGWPVRLVDTAGLRATDDVVEGEGVRRAEELRACADIVLHLIADDETVVPDARTLVVRTKSDLRPVPLANDHELAVSVVTGDGLDALRAALATRLAELARTAACDEPTSGEQDRSSLWTAARYLANTPDVVTEEDLVLLANDVRLCAECLGKRIHAVYSSDLLTALFSRFCVGK